MAALTFFTLANWLDCNRMRIFKIVNSNVFAHFVHRQDIKFFIYNKMIKDHV